MAILASSLVDGFVKSNFMGQGIVLVQLLGSVVMIAVAIGKWKSLASYAGAARRFLRDFATGNTVLEYYMRRRPNVRRGVEGIYKVTCERLLTLLSPEVRSHLVGQQDDGAAALTAREIELVRGTCEHMLDEEEILVGKGMGIIATIVALAPMLGLLGTVWGVLDAFAEMGAAGSANLATIAPSISSALVTTVVGLLVAIPGTAIFIDSGSTTTLMANLFPDVQCVIFTNSLSCGIELSKLTKARVYMVGGLLNRNSLSVVGYSALKEMDPVNYDMAFLGATSYDDQLGFTCESAEDNAIKRMAISKSVQNIILMDASKLGRRGSFTIGQLNEVTDVVMDGNVPDDFRQSCVRNNVMLH